MTAADLERLTRIVEATGNPKPMWFADTEVTFLLGLLTNVARTAGSHYSPSPDVWQQDGEIDALAILDTITGENHIRPGFRLACERCGGAGAVQELDLDYRPTHTEDPCKACGGTGIATVAAEK